MQITISRNKSTGLALYDGKACAVCGATKGGAKRWVFVFSYCQKAKVCGPCVFQIGPANVSEWLEKKAVFDKKGYLTGFRPGVVVP